MLFTDLSSDRIVNAFKKAGFKIVGGGKHITMADGSHFLTIPRHKRVNPYTLKHIIAGSGLKEEEFKKLVR